MSKTVLPQSQDWNQYWSLDQTQRFTKVSWSKRRIINVLSPYVGQGKKALDAGCGSGFFSKFFCDCRMPTSALDYSEKALEITKQKTDGQAQVFKMDLLSSSLCEEIYERFDIIFTDGLLEHFSRENQDKIVNNFLSLLNPKGVIITFVPNAWSPWELIRPFYMPGIEEKPFTLKKLIQLNERNGLKIVSKGGVNMFPFAFSPDQMLGHLFGMLLFTVAEKK